MCSVLIRCSYFHCRYKERLQAQNNSQYSVSSPNIIYSGPHPYADPGYLQMALGAYLTPASSGYKSVDPYFLSQGSESLYICYLHYKSITVIAQTDSELGTIDKRL